MAIMDWGVKVLKTGLFGVVGLGLAGTFVASSVMDTNWYLGGFVVMYFAVQLGFSFGNYKTVERLTGYSDLSVSDKKDWTKKFMGDKVSPEIEEYFQQHGEEMKVAVMVVGYREDPDFWRGCLESIRDHACGQASFGTVRGVYACVDGDSENDHFMTDIFHEVFDGSLLSRIEEEENAGNVSKLSNIPLHSPSERQGCKSQVREFSHGGKRETMKRGMDWIHLDGDYDYILVTDSDTVFLPNAVWSLVKVVHDDPQNGCATGTLEIFNRTTGLAKMVNARYLYAFNMERSAMSFAGCMNCCSGPFSIYRNSVLDETFLDDFVTQSCCSQKVGPGDDRHLTNLMLMKGYRSRQSPLSVAMTESPCTLERFFTQQLRWMRSFYREQYYQVLAVPHQSFYLLFVTIYENLFPYIVVLSFIPTFGLLYETPVEVLYSRILICLGIIVLRTTMLFVLSGYQWDVLYNIFMLPTYFCALLPMKVYALLTLCTQNWMTSDRLLVRKRCNWDVAGMNAFIVMWNLGYVVMGMYRWWR
jgi:hyaluronan synthase